jgi:hypothetical protein
MNVNVKPVKTVVTCLDATDALLKKVVGVYRKFGPLYGKIYQFVKDDVGKMIRGSWKIRKDVNLADIAEPFSAVAVSNGRPYSVFKCKETGDFIQGTFQWEDEEEEKLTTQEEEGGLSVQEENSDDVVEVQ